MSTAHVVLQGSHRPAAQNAKRLHEVDPNARVEITITLRGPELPGPNALPKTAMSPKQFAEKYGAKPDDADLVARTLETYGLKVEDVSLATRSMRVSGTLAQMEAAFQPKLGIYHSATQGDFRGREGDLMVPSDLNGIITSVLGLDNRRVARRKATTVEPVSELTAKKKAKKLKPLGPADLETRYHFPPGTGAGQQIAIAEFDGGYFPDDLQAYCQKFGRPVPNVTILSVGQNALTLNDILQLPSQQRKDELGASMEVMMDVQIVAGLCPAADIFVYFAPFTQKGWVDLLNKVISGNPAQPVTLSISWGLPEDSSDWSAAARNAINNRLQAAALQGITVCISSGDDGSGDEMTDGRAHVDFPSASPFTLSVGGTMLKGTATQNTEETWWVSPGRRNGHGGGATGGGVSVFFARPQWQNVHIPSLNPGSIDGRVIPDISALSGSPMYDLIFVGHDAPNGGTSASTPMWAALIARINALLPAGKQQRFLTPLLYEQLANGKTRGEVSCTDITVGQNASNPEPGKGYQAEAGFDAVTGWGVPNGIALLNSL
jgi:kumamolisin